MTKHRVRQVAIGFDSVVAESREEDVFAVIGEEVFMLGLDLRGIVCASLDAVLV